MSVIKINIINPVRPYIVFYHENDGLCGYLDTRFLDKGVRPIDTETTLCAKHKEAMELERSALQVGIKPLMDRWKNNSGLDTGYNTQEWILNTPVEQMMDPECKVHIYWKALNDLKALTFYHKYSRKKWLEIHDEKQFVELYMKGERDFSKEEWALFHKGEELEKKGSSAEHYILTNDLRDKTPIEQHLCKINPGKKYHIRQIDPYYVRQVVLTESVNSDWMGFVLDNPTKEKVQAAKDWLNGGTYDNGFLDEMSYVTLMGVDEVNNSLNYKVLFLLNTSVSLSTQFSNWSDDEFRRIWRKYQQILRGDETLEKYENRKEIVDDWFRMIAGDKDYCLLKRGGTMDIRLKKGLISGAVEDTSRMWPHLRPDLELAENKCTQYYVWDSASGWTDDTREELPFLEDCDDIE